MERRYVWFLLGGFLLVTLFLVALELPLPTLGAPGGVIPGYRYDPVPDVPGFFWRLDAEWIPPHVTTVAARRSGHGQWVYRGPTENYEEHCSAAATDPNRPENLIEQACGEFFCIPSLISPEEGAVLDNGRTDRLDDIVWDFDWSDCPAATRYHLYVIHPGALYPIIDNANITDSSCHYVSAGAYIIEANRYDWTWKVRAEVGGQWGPWSEIRTFDVEPVNTDPPSP